MNIIKKTSPHKSSRGGYAPAAIVIHISTSSLASCDAWFANPISNVSAHYCVGKRGEVHQYVEEKDSAWHAGRVYNPTAAIVNGFKGVNPNKWTVGIEHEGRATDKWPETQYNASAELIAEIAKRWQIPIDADHIIAHRAIYAKKDCPGYEVDLTKLIILARQFAGV